MSFTRTVDHPINRIEELLPWNLVNKYIRSEQASLPRVAQFVLFVKNGLSITLTEEGRDSSRIGNCS